MQTNNVVIISLAGGGIFLEEDLPIGGAEVQLYLLSQYLSKETGYKISVITSVKKNIKKKIGVNKNVYGILKLTDNKILKWLLTLFNIFIFLFENRPNYVIFRASPDYGAAIFMISFILGIRFVYSVAVDKVGNKFNITLHLLKYSIAVVQNTYQKKFLYDRKWKKVIQVPNMVESFNSKEINAENVLWIGRFSYQKNPELLVRVIRELEDINFVLIVSSVDEKYKDLWEEVHKLNNVKIYYRVPYKKMRSIRKGKVLLLTSRYEGTPNVVLESWAQGIPVLSWGVDVDGLLSKKKGGETVNEDMEQLKKKIREYMDKSIPDKEIQNILTYRYPEEIIIKWKEILK